MAAVSERTKAERFSFINQHHAELSIRYLCDWLKVSASGFYSWKKRDESDRAKSDRELTAQIEKIYWAHKSNYGSPRIYHQLKCDGVKVSEKRVARLMQTAGLVGKAARVYRRKARTAAVYMKLDNLRADIPPPTNVDEQWVGDLTYIRVKGQWRYLAVVMDLYSRRIIGWSLGKHKTAELTLASLRQAFRHREVTPGLIFHTDRGVEYGAYLVQDALSDLGIRASMNRPCFVTDNAHMESFFQSMKTEVIRGVSFEGENDLRLTLSEFIDEYYNKIRLHSSIGYCSPEYYEKQQAA